MNLLIDIGNSRIKWCLAQGRALGAPVGNAHDGYAVPADVIDSWQGLPRPEGIIIASVAGPVFNGELEAHLIRLWQRTPVFLAGSAEQLGVRNAYPRPENLGPDRWAALLGAWTEQLAPCCIVDAGTAVTVDVLDVGGVHQGGMIFAGLGLSRQALTERAHRLPRVLDGPLPALATDTEEAIRLGTVRALIGGVDHVLRRVRHSHGAINVVFSGGEAALLADALPEHNPVVRPHLVFNGLAAVLDAKT